MDRTPPVHHLAVIDKFSVAICRDAVLKYSSAAMRLRYIKQVPLIDEGILGDPVIA